MAEKSLKKNAILNVFRSILTMIFPLITFPYASRILLPEGTGKVNFANQTVSIFEIIATLGINIYALREAAKLRDDKEKLSIFCSQIFTFNFLTTIIAYALFFFVIFTVPKYDAYHSLLFIASAGMIFNTLQMTWLFQAVEEYTYITIQQIIFQILSLIFLFTFVKDSDDTLQYVCLSIISTIGSGIMNLFYHRKFIKLRLVSLKEIKPHIRPTLTLSGVTIATTVYTMLDTTMLGLFSNDRQIGLYSAAIKVTRLTTAMLSAISIVLLPRLSYFAERSGVDEEYDLMVKKSINITEILCIPSFIGIMVLAKPIINLLCGAEYNDSVFLLQLLSPVLFIILTAGVLDNSIFTPLRKDREMLIAVIAAAIINIVLNGIMIPKFGALGAVIGTLAAEFCSTSLKVFFARNYQKQKGFYSEIWKYFLAATIMGCAIYYMNSFISNSAIQIISGIILGSIIYYIILKILRCHFLKYIEDSIFKILRRIKSR